MELTQHVLASKIQPVLDLGLLKHVAPTNCNYDFIAAVNFILFR